MLELRYQTPASWTRTVLADFDHFLIDHAAAEKKASGMAVSMLSHYPDRPELVKAMIDLSIEEMSHFRDVVKIMQTRGLQLGADEKDPYVNRLRQSMRRGSEVYLLDRLVIGGIIEARGCERFGLIGAALEPGKLKSFYQTIASSESRHEALFIDLAIRYFDRDTVYERLDQLLDIEAAIVKVLPHRARLH